MSFDFNDKDFELLLKHKIRFEIDPENINLSYFFCLDNKLLYIRRARKQYQIAASSNCGFEPAFRLSVFDILYVNNDVNKVISMFKSYCVRLLNNELCQSDSDDSL